MSDRTALIVGEEGVERIRTTSVALAGCGAVGGYALEGLVRAGFGRIRVVDGDVFDETNLNRQILATVDTVGRPKAEVARERALSINPDVEVEALAMRVDADTAARVVEGCDVLVDAIDTVGCKVALLREASAAGVPVLSSMGAARRTDVTAVRVGRLDETRVCPLAAAVRSGMRGYDCSRMLCVYSVEPPVSADAGRDAKGKGVLGSLPTVPAIFGMALANEAVRLAVGLPPSGSSSF